MKTVQMTLDENLVKAVDSAAKKLGTTRSAFTREALRSALKTVQVREMESRQREGYKRKPVRWYQFSPPDKKRPVVILTRDSALEFLGEVTVAPITTTIRDIPTEVLLTKADGMLRDCAVNLDHIQTVSKGKIGSLIATLSVSKMQQMRPSVLFALGF